MLYRHYCCVQQSSSTKFLSFGSGRQQWPMTHSRREPPQPFKPIGHQIIPNDSICGARAMPMHFARNGSSSLQEDKSQREPRRKSSTPATRLPGSSARAPQAFIISTLSALPFHFLCYVGHPNYSVSSCSTKRYCVSSCGHWIAISKL